VINGKLIHQADLGRVNAPTNRDVQYGREGVAGCEDQLGFGEGQDMVEFLGLAAGVRPHVDTACTDNAEEQGGI
jgi:hypothetical protein